MENRKKQELLAHAEAVFEQVQKLQQAGLVCDDGDFVPSVHYPPITQYPDTDVEAYLEDYTLPEDGMTDIYIHIPFCIQHCLFCHYPGLTGDQSAEKEKYIGYLIREIDLYLKRFNIKKLRPRSILLGGGTPTYLKPELLDRFLTALDERIDYSGCKQYNVDLDPNSILGDVGTKRCEIMKRHGITRLTIGVQSLDDDVLKKMNRPHSASMAEEAVRKAESFGFDLNIEFIYGHPGETIDNWIACMERAVKLPVNEIQLYRLKVQSYGDAQGDINQYQRGSGYGDIPDFRTTMLMKQIAIDILNENGYHETIRRVYAKDRRVYSHYAYNQCCNQYDQVGFGLTGFSSYRDRFDINTQCFEEYYSMIDKGLLPITRGYKRPPEEQIRWAIVLPLKNSEVLKNRFYKKTGVEFSNVFRKKIQTLKEYGLVFEDDRQLALTELGKFVADEVCECFNADDYKPFPKERYADGPLNPYLHNTVFD